LIFIHSQYPVQDLFETLLDAYNDGGCICALAISYRPIAMKGCYGTGAKNE